MATRACLLVYMWVPACMHEHLGHRGGGGFMQKVRVCMRHLSFSVLYLHSIHEYKYLFHVQVLAFTFMCVTGTCIHMYILRPARSF